MADGPSFEVHIGSFFFSAHRSFDIAAMPAALLFGVLIAGRFNFVKERLWNEIRKGSALDGPPSLTLSFEDVLVYDARVCLAAAVLGQGSWWPGRLASYAVLAIGNPNEHVRLLFIWLSVTWLLVVDVWRSSLQTGLMCCTVAAFVCVAFLKRMLLAFTPVAKGEDLACALVAVTCSGCLTIPIARDSSAVSGTMCGIVTWFALLTTLVTLQKDTHWASDKLRHVTPADCEGLIEILCNWVEKAGVDLARCGFDAESLLRRYSGKSQVVRDVLSNQVSTTARRQLRADGCLLEYPYRRSQGETCVRFKYRGSATGDLVQAGIGNNFESLTKAVNGTGARRVIVCSNVQRPTVVMPVGDQPVPIILGKLDLERRSAADDFYYVDIDEILAVQPYRQLRLREVVHDDKETHGPVRSDWTMTIEMCLLTTTSAIALGWFRFGDDKPIGAATFWIAATFSVVMLLGQPADYVAIWRILDRCKRFWLREYATTASRRGHRGLYHLPILAWTVNRAKRWLRRAGVTHFLRRQNNNVLPVHGRPEARQTNLLLEWRRVAKPRPHFSARRHSDVTRGVWAFLALLCCYVARSIEGEEEAEWTHYNWGVAFGMIFVYWTVVLTDIGLSRGATYYGLGTISHKPGDREGRHRGRLISGCDGITSVTPGTHAIIEQHPGAPDGWWTTLD